METIKITKDHLYEMVYNAAKSIITELHSEFDMNSPEYREMYDGPDKEEDKAWSEHSNWPKLDDVGEEWLTHRKENEDEDFPRIQPYRSSEEERNGEWDDLERPGSYMHIRGFLKKNGKTTDDVERLIDKVSEKYGDPEYMNVEFRMAYQKIWNKSEFRRLRDEYVKKYHMDRFGGMERFPYETPYSQFDYFGKM